MGRQRTMLTTTSADGTPVGAYDEGHGQVILIVHPGMDDGTGNKQLAAILAKRFRVLRLHRRQYRLDLKTDPKLGLPCNTVAQEVEDIVALVRAVGERVLIYGHSSGAVVALEAVATSPSSFVGAVIFEPAAVIGAPLSGENLETLKEARAALADGKPGKTLTVFLRGPIRMAPWLAWLAGRVTAVIPRYRRLIPCQISDLEAMDRLGVRLDTYAKIELPVVMLGGEITHNPTMTNPRKNPAHIGERLLAVKQAIPSAELVIMPGRGHNANLRAPQEVAGVIEALADNVWSRVQ